MKFKKHFSNFLIISLIIHIFVVGAFWLTSKINPTKNEKFEFVLLDKDQTADTTIKNQAKRIVETDETQSNKIINEKAKFLSAKDNSTEKETLAQLSDKFKNTDSKSKSQPSKQATNENKATANKVTDNTETKLFGHKFDPYLALEKNGKNQKFNQTQGFNQGEGSTATDRIQGIDTSLKTALNTREYKYYGYYQRIKTQLNQFWQPEVRARVSRLLTQGRTIASESTNKVTKLIIVLNDSGTLVKVQVLGESGVRDLDEAAVEAFRQAAPFPNPPRGMIETDGTIKIRWDFVVES